MIQKYDLNTISTDEIILEEDRIFKNYKGAVDEFIPLFAKHNCEIEVAKCWVVDQKHSLQDRPLYKCNYDFFFCYQVNYKGKPIVYDDENSPISRSYIGLSVSRKKHIFNKKSVLTVYKDTEDIKFDLNEDLKLVISLFENN